MKNLLLCVLMLTGCATAKFERGDCLSPDPDKLEAWEKASKVQVLILDTGSTKYRVFAPTPMGYQPVSAKIKEVDEDWAKVECPAQVVTVLSQLPSTVK